MIITVGVVGTRLQDIIPVRTACIKKTGHKLEANKDNKMGVYQANKE
jgi:hypothetical protein